MIRFVLLDIDDTLLDFSACARGSMRLACGEMGLPFSERLAACFFEINPKLWKEIEAGRLTKEQLYAVRWDRIFASAGISGDGVRFEHVFHDFLAEAAEPIAGAAGLVRDLAAKYPLGVASNGWAAQQRKRLEKAGMLPYLSEFFFSETIGAAKPGAAFFRAVFDALPGVLPEEIFFLGDSLSADVEGGKRFNMTTCWFAPNGGAPSPFADYTVRALDEVRRILL